MSLVAFLCIMLTYYLTQQAKVVKNVAIVPIPTFALAILILIC